MGFLGQANQAQDGQPANRRRLYGSPAGDATGGGIPDPNSQVRSLFAGSPVTLPEVPTATAPTTFTPATFAPQPTASSAGEFSAPLFSGTQDAGSYGGSNYNGNRGGDAEGFMANNFFNSF